MVAFDIKSPFHHFAEQAGLANNTSTMPLDIRAEIEWTDFSCTSNPLGTPSIVQEAIIKAINEGDLGFVPNCAGEHLATVLSRYYEVDPECFMAGTSTSAMIAAIAQAYRPCNVGIPAPAPSEYFLAVANVGHNPLKMINPFSLAAIDSASAKHDGMSFDAAVLANPSYPCGRLLSERTLKGYLAECNWVVVDESRINLSLGGESVVHLIDEHPNLLVIRSLSDDLGIPGIPMGYVIGHPSSMRHIRQFSDGASLGMFHEVISKVLPQIDDFLEDAAVLLDQEIPWMQCMLSLTPGIKVFPSEANYVLCSLDERANRMFGIESAHDLVVKLQKAGYTIRDLSGTPGVEGKNFFLVSVRSHEENERFVSVLREVIDNSALHASQDSFV